MSDSNYPERAAGGRDAESGRSRAAVERELAERRASIDRRLESLEDEIVSTPSAIKTSIKRHPLIGLGGALVAGLAVGLIVTRKKKPDVAPFHQRLIEQYMDAVGDAVRHSVRRGRSIEDAVRDVLKDRAPFILYAPVRTEERESSGFFSQLADIALKTALGFTIKTAIDVFTARLDLEEFEALLANEADDLSPGGDGAVDAVDSTAEGL